MIILFGLRRLKKAMGSVLLRCANCGMSPVALLRVSTWFALFFIPVIPVSFKHYTVCPNCKRLDPVSKATSNEPERRKPRSGQQAAVRERWTPRVDAPHSSMPSTSGRRRAEPSWLHPITIPLPHL